MNKEDEQNKPPTQDHSEKRTTSDQIPNAHAAGDGATGRSKEAIMDDDLEDIKKEQSGKDSSASY